MQLFTPRVPKNEGTKVLATLHEAQALFPPGDFSLLCNLSLGSLHL